MGFFDDFGKKISDASQGAIAKTKDFADVAKLNSNISDEERRINNAYQQIGKLYFEMHLEDFEDCFKDHFAAINESLGKIQDYRQQITNIKGVVKCPNCGAEVPKDSAFCSSCGTPVPKQDVPAAEAVPVEEATPVEAPAEEAPAVEAPVEKKCPSCGATLENGALFCTNCGTKVEEN
ncbi:zinc ribbon domain-containing protein [Pseudobutyrivibrio ruminis]|uniref:zinc ribbon domain-containing protein n=1 Tax=Pseudobutyrivibrio ruminis TaxID=46206 RepID=UPI00068A8240|nr:zinc ribbon domain-containing protein [Pseudobutyrivibrio ruminis]